MRFDTKLAAAREVSGCSCMFLLNSTSEVQMYVLIAVFITTSAVNIGAYKGVSFQEFETKESCENAKALTEQMISSVRGYPGSDAYQLKCAKK